MACLKKMVQEYDVEIHVVRLPINQVAPFKIDNVENIHYYDRADYDNESLLEFSKKLDPDFICTSGWVDKAYLKVSKHFSKKIPTVLTFDNPWQGSVKQQISSLIGKLYISRIFSHCWVPGDVQFEYAKKLGFKEDQIILGLYSADVDYFHTLYKRYREKKKENFPKRILFVGRYTDHKGVIQMWNAFIKFQEKNPNDWELWCVGKGELGHLLPKHEKVKDFGFVQPADMDYYIENSSVFILPSKFEHWGVVVHEFAASGFAIISSDKTAAAHVFLKDGYNGFCHIADDQDSLEDAFNRLLNTPNEKLIEMGENSAKLADQISPSKWSRTIWDMISKEESCVA